MLRDKLSITTKENGLEFSFNKGSKRSKGYKGLNITQI